MNRRNFIAALASVPFVKVNASKPVALHPAWIPGNLVKGELLEAGEAIICPDKDTLSASNIKHLRAIGEQIGIDQTNDMFHEYYKEYQREIGEQIQKDTAEGVYELMAKQNKALVLK